MSTPPRLVLIDADGCLTPGEAGEWDWGVFQTIQDINRRAKRDGLLPAVTLCTGRQEPYVEALMQAIGGFVACIYENGCGLYLPDSYRFRDNPAITAEMRALLAEAKTALYEKVIAPGLGYFQPGKELSLTVYPAPGAGMRSLERAIRAALSSVPDTLTLQTSASCVDVLPAGIDKGQGVRWLAELVGISLDDMAGIGDSPPDLSFLRIVGRAAAPANAHPKVKACVDYVSPYANGGGVVDIIRRWVRPTAQAASMETFPTRPQRQAGQARNGGKPFSGLPPVEPL